MSYSSPFASQYIILYATTLIMSLSSTTVQLYHYRLPTTQSQTVTIFELILLYTLHFLICSLFPRESVSMLRTLKWRFREEIMERSYVYHLVASQGNGEGHRR